MEQVGPRIRVALEKIHLDELRKTQLVLLVILSVGLGYITWTVARNLLLSPLRHFPGPKIAALTKWWEVYHTIKCDKFKVIHNLHRTHGPVVRVGPNHLSFSSPEVFRQVYVKRCSAFLKYHELYSNIQPGLGPKYAGLFNFTDHQQALDERKHLQVKLSPVSLRQYELRFLPILSSLVNIMREKRELDLFMYFKFLMLDAIGDLAFDQSFHQLESGEEHQCVVDFNNAFMLIGLQTTFSWLIPLIPILPFKKLKDSHYGLQRVFKYAQNRVNAFLNEETPKPGTLMEAYLDGGKPKPPYSAWYIALSGHGFIVAGSESTSITLTYVIWLLIKHPDIQRRLRDEIKSAPEGYTGADLASLPLLDAVLKETLRIYPPAPSPMPRVVPPGGAEFEGVQYPPNTVIAAQPYTIHRDEGLFPNPELFNPDRWLDASPERRELMNRAFVPFSAGHRG
ncbi:hypothetical protein LCI18_013870 [Fusarium solani-melongenae]|uniref:Uncharacterized protein n=1 Tax=Fusarium solani subsp. cucurbitae TaxID=2747967 RepID=A0ACD3ZNY3_FUSSC|nr:hypothetical protein LCI18_013870 [Fusarium solani-melongenae]